MISFRLFNTSCILSLDDWCSYFYLPNNDANALRASSVGIRPSPDEYYNRMILTTLVNKGKYIQCPAIRYMFYVIANTLQA